MQYSQLISRGNINFTSNLADDGGGVVSLNSSVKLEGHHQFCNQHSNTWWGWTLFRVQQCECGGRWQVYTWNSAEVGGGIAISDGGILTLIGNNGFIGNTGISRWRD